MDNFLFAIPSLDNRQSYFYVCLLIKADVINVGGRYSKILKSKANVKDTRRMKQRVWAID